MRTLKVRQGYVESANAMELEIAGTGPRGRPKKTSMKIIEEGMCERNWIEEDAYNSER